ncbi:MAG: oligosaccharide flippase family protein, partial [Acidimicrobiales bacterium]
MSLPTGLRKRLRRIPLRDLAGGGGLAFLMASGTVGLSNFLFHVVVSRLLGPDRYGALGALLNVVLVLSVPLGAVQAAVTRTVALRGQAPVHLRSLARRSIVAGLAGLVVLAGLSPIIAGFLHLSSPMPVLMLALWVVPSVVGAVLQGVLVGRLRFTPFAVATLVGGGAGRLLFGVVLVEAGLGVTGAMLATTASAVVTTVIVAWPLRAELRAHPAGPTEHIALEHGMAMLTALGGYWVFVGIDTFLVRHLLAPHQAGLYAAAATGSRIVLFLPGALVTLAFPRFVADKGQGPESRRLLVHAMTALGLIGLVAAGVILVLPGTLVHVLFGKSFSGSAGTVGTLAMEAAVLGVISLLVYYHLARHSLL